MPELKKTLIYKPHVQAMDPKCNSAHNTQHTTHSTQHSTLNTQHTAHNTQHTRRNTQHTTHNTQHTTHNTQHTTHNTKHTSHNITHTEQPTAVQSSQSSPGQPRAVQSPPRGMALDLDPSTLKVEVESLNYYVLKEKVEKLEC